MKPETSPRSAHSRNHHSRRAQAGRVSRLRAAAVEPLERRLLLTAVVVNTTADSSDPAGSTVVSLRDAINIANKSTTPTTITFSSTVFATAKTITLGGKDLEISGKQPVTITGPAAGVTVNGNHASTDLVIDKGATATITGLTITGGKSSGNGGGITNNGAATLAGCTISGNSAYYGGGIDNTATLTLTGCTISGNSFVDGGGGIYNTGTAKITGCTVSGNPGPGGAGGGIDNTGTATLTDSTVSGNSSGGIYNSGTATLTDSTVSGNSGPGAGGGIYNRGTATLTGCTVSGNSTAYGSGGGIGNGGTATLSDCTISGNSAGTNDTGASFPAAGGGINNGTGPAVRFTLANTVVTGNTAPIGPDAGGNFNSLGFNLVGKTDGSAGWGFDDFTGTVAHPLNALLGPLANNGGPTQTLLPLPGSPAIDRGNNALIPAGTTTDQRGLPRISNATVDIGAVEVPATTPIRVTAPAAQSAATGQSKLFALGSFTQSSATAPFTVDVHWGDGSADSKFSVAAAGTIPATAHTFAFSGSRTAIVTVSDSAGHVSNSAPFVIGVTGSSTEVVNSASDTASGPGVVTLRDAIEIANSRNTATTITFDPKVFAKPQTITLNGSSLIFSNGSTTITGPAAGVTINGNQASTDFIIDKGATATISGLTITGGNGGNGNGGGIDNGGTLTLDIVAINGNVTQGNGGGIENAGTLTLDKVNIDANRGEGGGDQPDSAGGGVDNTGAMKIVNSTIDGNFGGSGGGVANYGTMALTDVTISGNSAPGSGGIANSGTAALNRVTVSNNRALGVADPGGGGPGSNGGIGNGGTMTLVDCTVSGNSDGASAGGIGNYGALTLADSTVTGNTCGGGGFFGGGNYGVVNGVGGGLDIASPKSSTVVENSIIAGNFAIDGTSPDVAGAVRSSGFNLIGQTNGSTGWKSTDLTGTSAHPLNPLLSPLGSFGGPTQTSVPLTGSPAIDHGSNALIPAGNTTDQRGLPRIGNHTVDIGAVEVQPTTAHIGVTARTGLKAVEEASASLSPGSFTAAGATGPYLVQVNWGDSTPNDLLNVPAPGAVPADPHTFAEEGVYRGTLLVIDALGHNAALTPFTVNVADAPLSGSAKSLSGVAAGVPFAWQVVYFTDVNPNSTASDFSAKINWGDGTTSAGVVASDTSGQDNGPYGVTGTHTYAKAGAYKFTATVSDTGGSTLTVSSTITCVNAKSIIVNTTRDQTDPSGSATVSLRDAVALADKSTTPTSITFDPKAFATAKTITLTGSELDLSSHTTISIVGPAAGVTISGNNQSTVLAVDQNVNASFSGLKIAGGKPGISNAGVLFLTNCSVVGNSDNGGGIGGGISNQNFMILTGDTISGNQSSGYGSGISNDGKMTLIDCTVASNSDGGIVNGSGGFADLTVLDSTISGNTGSGSAGGIYSSAHFPGVVMIANSIIAGNSGNNDVSGSFDSLGFNLVGNTDGSSGWISSDLTGNSAKPLNPKLGPLANNGGPTQTLLPLSGSPAINHGSNALVPAGVTTDQRGLPRIVGGVVDIGAVEVQSASSAAAIIGTVFNDANGDGTQDNGETGLTGVEVYADLGNVGYFVSGDPNTTTNAAGGYALAGLAAGNYIVRQVRPSGYVQTIPLNGYGRHVTVSAGQTLSGQNFGDKA